MKPCLLIPPRGTGPSVVEALARILPDCHPGRTWAELLRDDDGDARHWAARGSFCGPFGATLLSLVPDAAPFVFLRDPVDRALALAQECTRTGWQPVLGDAPPPDPLLGVAGALEHPAAWRALANGLTRQLALAADYDAVRNAVELTGDFRVDSFPFGDEPPLEEQVRRAKEVIDRAPWVGLWQEIGPSAVLLYPFGTPPLDHYNPDEDRLQLPDGHPLRSQLEALNGADRVVYEYGVDAFRKNKQAHSRLRSLPKEAPRPAEEELILPTLSVVMAVWDDPGHWATVNSIRLHQHVPVPTEFVVVDNHPAASAETRDKVEKVQGRYVHDPEVQGTAYPRDRAVRLAANEVVLCLDPHVLLLPDCLNELLAFFAARRGQAVLAHGPMWYEDLRTHADYMKDEWGEDGMRGVWEHNDPRHAAGEPYEIPMHGLGFFAFWRAHWWGFHPDFRGFGGEEGYLHDKVRAAGGTVWNVPACGWMHDFGKHGRGLYPNDMLDRFRNYLLGHRETGRDPRRLIEVYRDHPITRHAVAAMTRLVQEVYQ